MPPPSSFTQSASAPSRAPSRVVRTNGVQPSPRLMIEASEGGSTGAYRHMLEGPVATSRRRQRCRMLSRSYRTSTRKSRHGVCSAVACPSRIKGKCAKRGSGAPSARYIRICLGVFENVIGAAHHVGNAHVDVVGHDAQVVSGMTVRAERNGKSSISWFSSSRWPKTRSSKLV